MEERERKRAGRGRGREAVDLTQMIRTRTSTVCWSISEPVIVSRSTDANISMWMSAGAKVAACGFSSYECFGLALKGQELVIRFTLAAPQWRNTTGFTTLTCYSRQERGKAIWMMKMRRLRASMDLGWTEKEGKPHQNHIQQPPTISPLEVVSIKSSTQQ